MGEIGKTDKGIVGVAPNLYDGAKIPLERYNELFRVGVREKRGRIRGS